MQQETCNADHVAEHFAVAIVKAETIVGNIPSIFVLHFYCLLIQLSHFQLCLSVVTSPHIWTCAPINHV